MFWKPYWFLKITKVVSVSLIPLFPVSVSQHHINAGVNFSGPSFNQVLNGENQKPNGLALQFKLDFD